MKIVSFSGIDGSGKSTFALRAYALLRENGIDARIEQIYRNSTYLRAGRFLGRLSKNIKGRIEGAHSSKKGSGRAIFGTIRKICLLSDIALFNLKTRYLTSKRVVLICDRYFFDIIAHCVSLGILNDKEEKYFLSVVPKSDLPFLLVTPDETAFNRERAHDDIAYYRQKNRIYENLAAKTDFISVDSSGPSDTAWSPIEGLLKRMVDDRRILMVSRPAEPPWDEASKNLVRDIASNISDHEFHIMTTKEGIPRGPVPSTEAVYTDKAMTLFQKIRLFAYLIRRRHDFDIYHFCFTPEVLTSFLLKRIMDGRRCVQNIPYLTGAPQEDRLKKLIYANEIVVNSKYSQDILRGHDINNVTLIYPGVDMRRFAPVAGSVSHNEFRVAWAGKFASDTETEAIGRIITEACNKDGKIKFVVAARLDGKINARRQENFKNKIKKAALENRVSVLNSIDDMAAFIASCDLLIYPFFCGFKKKIDIPYVIIEAMASGKPVMISDKGPLNELITLGAGMAVAGEDAEEFASQIVKLSNDSGMQNRLGVKNREVALRHFDLGENIASYRKIYDSILRKEYRAGEQNSEAFLGNNELAAVKNETLDKVIEYYDELSLKFAQIGRRSFVMKTFRTYPYADNDMDMVLVDKDGRRDYLKALGECGYGNIWNVSILREPGKRFYVKLSADGKIILPIVHIHYTVSWNGIDCLDAERIWSRLRKIDANGRQVMGPSVEDELLITAAHTLFENTYITAGELLHLKTILAEKSDIDAAYIVRSCRENNWLPAFRKYILYADNCSKCYSGRALFDPRFVSAIGADAGAAGYPIDRYPPYFLPPGMLISSYAGKFFKDIVCMKFRKLPRELVTFGLVIWLWRHKKMQKFKRGITV